MHARIRMNVSKTSDQRRVAYNSLISDAGHVCSMGIEHRRQPAYVWVPTAKCLHVCLLSRIWSDTTKVEISDGEGDQMKNEQLNKYAHR